VLGVSKSERPNHASLPLETILHTERMLRMCTPQGRLNLSVKIGRQAGGSYSSESIRCKTVCITLSKDLGKKLENTN